MRAGGVVSADSPRVWHGLVDLPLTSPPLPLPSPLFSQRPAPAVALRIAKDPRFERYPCIHKGTYADDCLVHRAGAHKCFIVATCDKDLKRRLRKIPGVPIMYISQHRYSIERFPDANNAPST